MRPARALMLLVALASLWLPLPASVSTAQARGLSDPLRAARMLADWRYDEARPLIARLERQAPDAIETRYLMAELAFIDGHYARVVQLLDGIDDQTAGGNVGQLRALAASTLSVTRDFVSRESPGGHFVIHYAPGKDEVIVDLTGELLETAHRTLGEDLGFRPAEKIRVELLGQPADLARLSPLTEAEIETTGTIALCKYGKLMVVSPRATIFGYPWMDTLMHEYVHYAVSRMSHDNVPVWLHEGLARFQQTRWRKAPDGTLPGQDEHLLAGALKKGKLITFDEMHPSMAKLPSQEAAALAFAEVFTMVSYLYELVGYEGIRRIILLQQGGKSARRAVAEVLNKPWNRIERDWRGYLRGRNLKQSKALASRARSRRIRFEKASTRDEARDKNRDADGAENVGIDEVVSIKARKHARLGDMLRARGMAGAAAIEYEKALTIVGADEPFVAAKLSRTYLELGKYDKAVKLATPLAAADEYDASPAVTLGLAYMSLGSLNEARAALESALRISPFDPAVRCSLAEIYQRVGDASRAQREGDACRRLRQ